MKKIIVKSMSILAFSCIFNLISAQNSPQKNEVKNVVPVRKTPSPEELKKQANSRSEENRRNSEIVIQNAKKLEDNSGAAMALYTLKYTKNAIIKKVENFDKNMSTKDYVAWLNERLSEYKSALKEANEISKSKINFTENDKVIINDYKAYYLESIPKFEAEISSQKK